jgi:hypothetical protein
MKTFIASLVALGAVLLVSLPASAYPRWGWRHGPVVAAPAYGPRVVVRPYGPACFDRCVAGFQTWYGYQCTAWAPVCR